MLGGVRIHLYMRVLIAKVGNDNMEIFSPDVKQN